jgi:hypothetical protein
MTMDIRALLLINSDSETARDRSLAAAPLPFLDVAGRSPLLRTADRLRHYGVSSMTVVVEDNLIDSPGFARLPGPLDWRNAAHERFWREAEGAFAELAQGGAELILLLRMGAYAEIDFEKLVQFHLEQQSRVSQAAWESQPLQVFCLSASRRNDAASLFRSRLSRCRSECPLFVHSGYVNALVDMHDLRQFGVDVLTLQTESPPAGREARPGIWIGSGAVIEKGARLVAPAFIGPSARICSSAVVTRCSAVERHARVDCGTVVENSTVLPYVYIGSGLDLAHSVAGNGHIANLRRNVTVPVNDRKLLGTVGAVAGQGLLSSTVELLSSLPGRVWQALTGKTVSPQPGLDHVLRSPSPTLQGAADYHTPASDKAAGEFSSGLAVARRYGDQ